MRLKKNMVILYHGKLYKILCFKGVLHAVRKGKMIHIADITDDYVIVE